MSLRFNQLSTLALITVLFFSGCQTSKGTTPVEEEKITYLDAEPQLEKSRPFQSLKNLSETSSDYEKMRINYLLERMGASDYIFIRNDEHHSSKRAVSHLKWKYWRLKKKVSTAEDFIEQVGTRSKMSGHYYLVQVEDKRYDPLNKLLYAELDRLMTLLTSSNHSSK